MRKTRLLLAISLLTLGTLAIVHRSENTTNLHPLKKKTEEIIEKTTRTWASSDLQKKASPTFLKTLEANKVYVDKTLKESQSQLGQLKTLGDTYTTTPATHLTQLTQISLETQAQFEKTHTKIKTVWTKTHQRNPLETPEWKLEAFLIYLPQLTPKL